MTLRRRLLPSALTALLAIGAVLVSGCGAQGTGDKGYVDGNGIITRLAPAERIAVNGDVSGKTLAGEDWSLADHRGKVVVVNVWGTWCPPCRKEAPTLGKAARELASEGVVFVGINTRDSGTAQGLAFEKNFDVPYPSIFDPDGRTLLAFRGTLPPNAIPSTLVIDRDGKVAASVLGEVTRASTLVGLVHDVARAGD